MSSIPGPVNPIASSLSQQAVQQGQVARGLDQKRNEAARFGIRRDEEIRRHTESVEDSYEASDEHLIVEADRHDQQQGQSEGQSKHTPEKKNQDEIPPPAPRLDLQA